MREYMEISVNCYEHKTSHVDSVVCEIIFTAYCRDSESDISIFVNTISTVHITECGILHVRNDIQSALSRQQPRLFPCQGELFLFKSFCFDFANNIKRAQHCASTWIAL